MIWYALYNNVSDHFNRRSCSKTCNWFSFVLFEKLSTGSSATTGTGGGVEVPNIYARTRPETLRNLPL